MQVNIEVMARENGLRPNELRIELGIPTAFQRDVRKAETFMELVSLPFPKDEDRFNSCGPKFEEEDREEYLEKRKLFFAIYIETFPDVLTLVKEIGKKDNVYFVQLLEDEVGEVLSRVKAFLSPQVEAANSLDEFMRLKGLMDEIQKSWGVRGDRCWLNLHDLEYGLERSALYQALKELEKAKGVSKTINLLGAWRLFLKDPRRDPDRQNPQWQFALDRIETIRQLIALWQTGLDSFSQLGNTAFEAKAKQIVGMEVARAMQHAGLLSRHEQDGRENKYYSHALVTALLHREVSEDELEVWRTTWVDRKLKSDRNEGLPKEYFAAWDLIHLSTAKKLTDEKEIRNFLKKASYQTETHGLLRGKLRKIGEKLIAQTESEDDIRKIGEKYDISYFDIISERKRKRDKLKAQKIIAESNDKDELRGAYQQFKDREPDKARIALLKLVQFYPAEVVDEIPIEVPSE
jgi:hypothetical protein